MVKLEFYPFISLKFIYHPAALAFTLLFLFLNTFILLITLYYLHKNNKRSPEPFIRHRESRMNRKDYYFLLAIILAAIVFRAIGIEKENMALREYYYYSQNVSLKSMHEVIFNSLSINLFHQPLYNLIIYFISRFSQQEIIFRSVSLFFGILTVALLFKFAYEMFGRKAAFVSAVLISLNPIHIFWSKEISPYSLFCFIALSSYYFFYRAFIQKHYQAAIWYCCSMVAGYFCHYFMWFVIFSQALIFCTIYYFKKTQKSSIINSLYFLLTIVISNYFFIAWCPFLHYALNNQVHKVVALQNKICFLSRGYSSFLFFNLIPYFSGITLDYAFVIWPVIAFFVISLVMMYKYFKTECLLLFIPIFAGLVIVGIYLVVFNINFKGLVIIWEYNVYLFPLITLALAFLLGRFLDKKLILSIFCLILIMMLYCDYGLFKKLQKPDFSGAVNFIKHDAINGDALFFPHEWYSHIFYYYMLKANDIGDWPGVYVKDWRKLARAGKAGEAEYIRYYGPVWQEMVYSQDPFLKEKASIKEDLDRAGVGRIWVLDIREQYFGIPMVGYEYNDDILAWFKREYPLIRYKEFEYIKLYLFDSPQ